MPSLPWFPFYYKDFSLSRKVVKMSHAQKGAYVELLGQEWDDPACSLPNRLDDLKDLVQWKGSDEDFQLIRSCFTAHPERKGRLHNARLYFEWQKVEEKRTAAKASAQKRWQKPATKPTPPPRQPQPRSTDRTTKGFESIGSIADKHFKPL